MVTFTLITFLVSFLIIIRLAAGNKDALAAVAAAARDILRLVRYPHATANFLVAVAVHHSLLADHPDAQTFLLEALQYNMGGEAQKQTLQVWGVVAASHIHVCTDQNGWKISFKRTIN